MSSLRQSSNFKSQTEKDSKIEPYEHSVEFGHVNGSNDHGCGQPYHNMCSEVVVLCLGCYHVHLENRF